MRAVLICVAIAIAVAGCDGLLPYEARSDAARADGQPGDGAKDGRGDGAPDGPGGCMAGQHLCGAGCVNLVDDPLNCGGCGVKCGENACVGGKCCATCVHAGGCVPQVSGASCGIRGEACHACPGSTEQCKVPACDAATGACTVEVDPDGAACGAGRCHNGVCCEGCWNEATGICESGLSTAACGAGGAKCVACAVPTCLEPTCVAGQCQTKPWPGAPCLGGRCAADGTCCTGCLDKSVACQTGNSAAACGSQGNPCDICNPTAPDPCAASKCTSSTCQLINLPGSQCMGGAGICANMECCIGCVSGGICYTGNTDAACGSGGAACKSCLCKNGTC
jgi:hypothetical protein